MTMLSLAYPGTLVVAAKSIFQAPDTGGLQKHGTLPGHGDGLLSAIFSPDGRTVASDGAGGTVQIWDLKSRSRAAAFDANAPQVCAVAFSPDGRLIAAGSSSGLVQVWDVAGKKKLLTLTSHSKGITSLAFSPDGSLLASSSKDGTVTLGQVPSGREKARRI
jgi:WD40 repeat protein